jgi:hypothetical protein
MGSYRHRLTAQGFAPVANRGAILLILWKKVEQQWNPESGLLWRL